MAEGCDIVRFEGLRFRVQQEQAWEPQPPDIAFALGPGM